VLSDYLEIVSLLSIDVSFALITLRDFFLTKYSLLGICYSAFGFRASNTIFEDGFIVGFLRIVYFYFNFVSSS